MLASASADLGNRIFKQHRQTPLPQIWFDVLDQNLMKMSDQCVVVRDPDAPCRRARDRNDRSHRRRTWREVDAGKPLECRGPVKQLGLAEWTAVCTEMNMPDAGRRR